MCRRRFSRADDTHAGGFFQEQLWKIRVLVSDWIAEVKQHYRDVLWRFPEAAI
jgi:hypothetical protein